MEIITTLCECEGHKYFIAIGIYGIDVNKKYGVDIVEIEVIELSKN